ncbi:MAG: tyrosine-type recombinase/integrase, partial [Bacteroidia bacterium]|nr:tyrosine-type recombinase/integrase [Bacteroidia bacterium]
GDIRINVNGGTTIRFKFAFRWINKLVWYQCGTWPHISLETIRENRDKARQLVRSRTNPNDHKKAEHIEGQARLEAVIAEKARQETQNKTFGEMFAAWVTDGVSRKDGNAEINRAFSKDVLPVIGVKPVKHITEHDLRALLRAMVSRGVNRMAVCVYNDLVQLFDWAEKRQPWRGLMVEGNPVHLLEMENIVSKEYEMSDERDRILSPDEIRQLRSIFEGQAQTYANAAAGSKYEVAKPIKKETQLALWICLSTLSRIGETLMSEWKHVDLVNGVWDIPVENVKGARGKKRPHKIYLSNFALSKFKELHDSTGHTPYCFPSRNHDGHVCVKSVSKQVGDRQTQFKKRTRLLKNRINDNSLVLAHGLHGEWTPHDLRRTGSTMMQALRVVPDVIDRCQNHIMAGSRVRKSYLHYDYADEKREAWAALGSKLEQILSFQHVLADPSDSGPIVEDLFETA